MKYIIYKIRCLNPAVPECYVGSSKSFNQRKYSHRLSCECEASPAHNYPIYRKIREAGGFGNWEFQILEEVETENRVNALIREQFHKEQQQATLNIKNPKQSATYFRDYDRIRNQTTERQEYIRKHQTATRQRQKAEREAEKNNTI